MIVGNSTFGEGGGIYCNGGGEVLSSTITGNKAEVGGGIFFANSIKLINSIDAEKSEIILIGDTTHDCEVAREAGIKAIAVSHGHHSCERLQKCGFEVYKDLKEIEAFLLK